MLTINDLHAKVEGDKSILKGVNLSIGSGEVHAVMGPNGSGKSTLASVLSGKEGYDIEKGAVQYLEQDLLAMTPDERAHLGVFLGFQYPVEIPGVNNVYLLREAYNAARRARNEKESDAIDFLPMVQEKMALLDMGEEFIRRSVNEGFSGGEKKRNEILQMLVLKPSFVVLDEIDSGLDVDALKIISKGVNAMRDANRSFLLITHYQRLLNHIQPDFVHVMVDGKIIESGGPELARQVEEKGYGWLLEK